MPTVPADAMPSLEIIMEYFTKFEEFRIAGEYTDVTFDFDEISFKCHRIILASASAYFRAMFRSEFQESKASNITLQNIDSVTFECILKFLYTSNLTITNETVYPLLRASDFLKIDRIDVLCIEYIERNVNQLIDIALEIFIFACNANKKTLVDVLTQFIVENFNTFYETEKFLEIPLAALRILLKQYSFQNCSNLSRRNENVLLDAIIRWTHHSPERRKGNFEELVKAVDFENVSSDYMKALLLKKYEHMLDDDNDKDKDLVPSTSAVDDLDLKDIKHNLTLHVYAGYKEDDVCRVFSINSHTDRWIFSCVTEYFNKMQCIGFSNHLYCLTYLQDSERMTSNYCEQTFSIYPSAELETKHAVLKCPPICMEHFDICAARNSIYLYNQNVFDCMAQSVNQKIIPNSELTREEIARGIYLYKPDVNKWFPVPEMRTKLCNSSMTSLNDVLYLIAGHFNGQPVRIAQSYDCRVGKWQTLPKTHYKHIFSTCCAHRGKIYISNTTEMVFEVYDPVAGKWDALEGSGSGIKEAPSHKLVSYDGQLWVISHGDDYWRTESFDPVRKKWNIFHDVPIETEGTGDYEFSDAIVFKPIGV